MGNYTYRDKPHVAVPNDVFDKLLNAKSKIDSAAVIKTTGLDVVEAFTLYFVCLLRMDWKREAEIQMRRLTERYFGKARPESYATIKRYLLILETAGLIEYSGDKYTGTSIITIKVMPVEKPFSLIACVNEHLITSAKTGVANSTFALHCLLNIKRTDKRNIWEPVLISQDKLATTLNICKTTTLRESDNILLTGGFITRTLPQHYVNENGKARTHMIQYTVHDYDNPVNNRKTIDGIARQKAARQGQKALISEIYELFKKFDKGAIVLIGGYVKALDSLRQKDNEFNRKFYRLQNIDNYSDIADLIDMYDKTELDNGDFLPLLLPRNRSKAHQMVLQEALLKFVENNPQLPIVILSEHDYMTAPFLSRMWYGLKKSSARVRDLRFEPIHKGYLRYDEKYRYYSYNNMIKHASDECPEILKLTVTNSDGNPTTRRLDNLISSLTMGKTYIDILEAEADIAKDISIETKYLSLSLKRSDLSRADIIGYETSIQSNIKGE